MVSVGDIKFYKSASGGLGGAIDTGSQVSSSSINNLFPPLTETEANAGVTQFSCIYIKNTGTETLKQVGFRLDSESTGSSSVISWAKGPAGKNATEVGISDINSEPAGVTDWKSISNDFTIFGDFAVNDRWGIWIRWVLPPSDVTAIDDSGFFKFKFNIASGGTSTGGDTSGGGSGETGGNSTTVTNYKIAVAGDWGCESMTDKVMDMCKLYDLVISVGDDAYASASCWLNRVTSRNLKSKMSGSHAYGNHEYEESGGISPYKNYFGHAKTYYMSKFQNVGIIVIDSNINMDTGSTQNNAIKGFLTTLKADPEVDWIVATYHHPTYGSSSQHSYNDGNSAQAFWDLFDSNGVSFIFTGHNHNWGRTKQLAWSGSYSNPTVVDSTSPYSAAAGGIIEVRSGAGGHDSGQGLYSLGSQSSYVGYQNRTHNGIWEAIASNNGQTWTCSFVDTSGTKYDTFTITTT